MLHKVQTYNTDWGASHLTNCRTESNRNKSRTPKAQNLFWTSSTNLAFGKIMSTNLAVLKPWLCLGSRSERGQGVGGWQRCDSSTRPHETRCFTETRALFFKLPFRHAASLGNVSRSPPGQAYGSRWSSWSKVAIVVRHIETCVFGEMGEMGWACELSAIWSGVGSATSEHLMNAHLMSSAKV